jgi:pimeloyl-ACP methyl ester carboxylesterase
MLLASLAQPPLLKVSPKVGTVMGLGSAIHGLIAGSRAGVGRFLNQLTYYEMKKRAGIVGVSLADAVLARLAPARPIRLHLVGHSFGGRVVTAAADRMAQGQNLELFSVTILQGAYSHNALARQIKPGLAGAFPSVVGKPTGPIVFTHTHNDLACTVAYALASRLSRDITQGIGDASDEFGAMGANGPQKLEPGAAEADDTTQTFAPKRGKVNTFLADQFIIKTASTDAHNNITNPTVGRLLAKTILS